MQWSIKLVSYIAQRYILFYKLFSYFYIMMHDVHTDWLRVISNKQYKCHGYTEWIKKLELET